MAGLTTVTSGGILDGTITNADINASAAIDSSKVSGLSTDSITEGNTTVEVVDTGSDGHITFDTEGSERMRIDNEGKIGIGVTNPGDYHNSANQLVVKGATNGGITIRSNGTSDSGNLWFADGDSGDARYRGMVRYEHDTDAMVFKTAGDSERMRIDSSGRLLLGTSSTRTVNFWDTPQVQIEGTNYQESSLSIYNNQNFTYGAVLALGHSRGTSLGSNTVVQNNDYLGTIAFYGSDGSDERRGAEICAFSDGTPGSGDMPGRLVFSTTADGSSSPTERMRITSDGNVGIGTTSPGVPLHVKTASGTVRVKIESGDSNAASLFLQNSTTGNGNSDGFKLELGGNEEAYIWMNENAAIRFGTNNSERMSLLNSGYFGINKTAPATQLHVRGQNTSSRGQMCIEGQDVSARLTLYQGTDFIGALQSTDDSVNIAVETGHEIRLVTNNTNRLIVKDGGDIELGNNVRSRGSDNGFTFGNKATHTDNTTTTQGSSFSKTRGRFDSCQNTSGYNNIVCRHTHTSGTQYMIEFWRLQNQSGGSGNFGNVGYITTSHTATQYQSASDYRLKENVVALTGAIDRVKQLQPKRFNFKLEPGKVVDGFMAHEAQTVVPESVSGTKDEVANFGNLVNDNGDVIESDVREPDQLEEGETWVKTETKPVYQGIDSAKLVPLLTAALQEAIAEIETLKTKVAALEAG